MTETVKSDILKIKLSENFKKVIKEEFKNINCRLELIINQGGIRDGKIEFKISS